MKDFRSVGCWRLAAHERGQDDPDQRLHPAFPYQPHAGPGPRRVRQDAAGWRETPVLRAACTLTGSGSLGGAGAGQYTRRRARANAGIIPIGGDVCADFETELAEFNGETNHVHMLVNFPPKVALSRLVNSLKGVSSGRSPRPGPGLLAGEPAVVRVVLRRIGRRRTHQRPAGVHRAAEPARLTPAGSVRLHHRPEGRRTSGQVGSEPWPLGREGQPTGGSEAAGRDRPKAHALKVG
jgi:hypothetical protein